MYKVTWTKPEKVGVFLQIFEISIPTLIFLIYRNTPYYLPLFGFLYHGTKLVETTQKKFKKVSILDSVPVRKARKRYPPFS